MTMSIDFFSWTRSNCEFYTMQKSCYIPFLLLLLILSACEDTSTISHIQTQESVEESQAPDHLETDFTPEGKKDGVEANAARIPLPGGLINSEDQVVFFAPDDPTLTLELALIDRVINDCRELPSPSQCRIRYAVYNLTSELLTQKLIKAAQEGIKVQVLIEADQLSSSREWNLINERFIEAGLHVEYDQKYLTDSERKNAHLIGIDGHGLMHLKMRLFEAPSWKRLLTGSLNPNTTAHLNDETLHLINDEDLMYQYSIAYDSVLYNWPFYNSWNENTPINVLFTPATSGQRASDKIFEWIAEEQEQILLMVFSLRDLSSEVEDRTLSELLIDKAKAGVPVYVITDRKQSDRSAYDDRQDAVDDDMEDILRAGGVPVYEVTNHRTPYTAMHHKVAILGRSKIDAC